MGGARGAGGAGLDKAGLAAALAGRLASLGLPRPSGVAGTAAATTGLVEAAAVERQLRRGLDDGKDGSTSIWIARLSCSKTVPFFRRPSAVGQGLQRRRR